MSAPVREEIFASPDSRFEFGRCLGQSRTAVVWLADDRKLGRHVAVKTPRDGSPGDRETVERFLRAASVCARLSHPAIVPVHDFGAFADGRPYLVMPVVEGMTLAEAIEEYHALPGSLEPTKPAGATIRKLLERFVEVCGALEYAHSRGIVHRGVEPASVIVRPAGAMVVGWDLAREIEGFPEGPGRRPGTPNYLSPEQARGETVGPRSDVYSLGATLYAILAGRPPRTGEESAVMEAARRGEFVPLEKAAPRAPGDLAAVCTRALAADPTVRDQTARELAEEVTRCLADEPVKARQEPAGAAWRRWATRHRAALTALLLAVGVFGVALPLGVWACARLTAADDRMMELELQEMRTRQEVNDTRSELARAKNAAGKLLLEAGKHDEALPLFQEAREIDEGLANDNPEDSAPRVALAATENNLGDALVRAGKPAEARKSYQAAKSLLLALAEEGVDPDFIGNRRQLARSYGGLAELEADAATRVGWRLKQADALLGAGDYLAASAVAEAVAKERLTAEQQYELAGVLARCAASADGDRTRPQPVRQQQAETWSRQALDLLRGADRAGHFRDADRLDKLEKDANLDFLRHRDDFKAWLAGVK
jgi:serine/threonine-protein kinase